MTLVEKLKSECVSGIDIAFAIGECTEEEFESSRDYLEGFKDCRERAIKIVENYDPWIPANQPPRKDGEYIVVIAGATEATTLQYDRAEDSWFTDINDEYDYYNVIKWQPLPEA